MVNREQEDEDHRDVDRAAGCVIAHDQFFILNDEHQQNDERCNNGHQGLQRFPPAFFAHSAARL